MNKLLLLTCCTVVLLTPLVMKATPVTTNLVCWLRADDLNGDGIANNPANGTPIANWLDSHTSFKDFSQTNLDYQPTYQATGGPGGKPAVVFDGTNDDIWRTGGITHDDPTYFIVAKNDTSGSGSYLLLDYAAPPSGLAYRGVESRPSGVTQSYGRDASGNTLFANTPGPDVGKFQLYVSWVGSADGIGQMNWRQTIAGASGGLGDGATISGDSGIGFWNPTTWTASLGGSGTTLGGAEYGSSARDSFAKAAISEVLIYSGAMSETDRTAVENYLIAKYSAGSAHPGDFDSDGDVDGADFVAWQTNFPKANGATLAQGDADGDTDVDGADFVVWQTNFPFTPGPGISTVPEPQSFVLAALCGLIAAVGRYRKN